MGHCLDVMHILKNVGENVLYSLLKEPEKLHRQQRVCQADSDSRHIAVTFRRVIMWRVRHEPDEITFQNGKECKLVYF